MIIYKGKITLWKYAYLQKCKNCTTKVPLSSKIYFFIVEETCTVYVQEGEIKKEEIKEENVFIKEELPSPSTEEDTCTVYIKEEDDEMENTEIKGNDKVFIYLLWLPGYSNAFQVSTRPTTPSYAFLGKFCFSD